jgi:hypothetical protein
MKKLQYALLLAALGVAYLLGYWPEHRQLVQTRGDLRAADRELADLRGRLRISRLESILLAALQEAARQNYDQARAAVQQFSIELAATAARPDMKSFEPRLRPLMNRVDGIETSLQKKDHLAARDSIRGLLTELSNIVVPPTPGELPAVLRTPSGQTP